MLWRKLHILIVDDSAEDRELVKRAFEGIGVNIALHEVVDGQEVLAFLSCEAPFENVPRPDLILLDLNLPKLDGHEVLQFVKGSPSLKRIPVIVFSSSEAPADILRSYEAHASSYITKPFDMTQLTELCTRIKSYWLDSAKFPPRGD